MVLDPVLGSGAGVKLADQRLIRTMTEYLLPHASVITPNLEEAVALTGCNETAQALRTLLDLGCDTALITAADNGRDQVINTWMSEAREIYSYRWKSCPGFITAQVVPCRPISQDASPWEILSGLRLKKPRNIPGRR